MLDPIALSRFIVHQTEERTIHWQKLVKMLFLVDLVASSTPGVERNLTGLSYIADENGPVPSNLEGFFKSLAQTGEIVRDGDFLVGKVTDDVVIIEGATDPEINIARRVWHRCAFSTWRELSDICHELPSWIGTKLGDPIDPKLMRYTVRLGKPEALNGVSEPRP